MIDGASSMCSAQLGATTTLLLIRLSENRIFAIEADGFDTVGFYDEAAQHAEDAGLLGWLTGCVGDVSDFVLPDEVVDVNLF